MIVVDACIIVDALLRVGSRARPAALAMANERLAAPHHVDVEVISGLRRVVLGGIIDERRAGEAMRRLRGLEVARYEHSPLYRRIWELRENVTAPDAAYVALAEKLGAPLLTSDARLAGAAGPRCEIRLIS